MFLSRWRLASGGTVEDNPNGEILGKVLEAMLGSSRHEEKIARFEGIPLAVVKEHASAADDDVDFVLSMRCLLVGSNGKGKLYVQGAALHEADGVFACGTRDTSFGLYKTDDPAAVCFVHDALYRSELLMRKRAEHLYNFA